MINCLNLKDAIYVNSKDLRKLEGFVKLTP
jgi:hypothetical protein